MAWALGFLTVKHKQEVKVAPCHSKRGPQTAALTSPGVLVFLRESSIFFYLGTTSRFCLVTWLKWPLA